MLIGGPSFTVYEWYTTPEFLISAVVPDATIITGSVEDSIENIQPKLPSHLTSFLFHLNCTKTALFPICRPRLIEHLNSRGVPILNAHATDISKRYIQQKCADLGLPTTLASREGDPEEKVMVKTNLNFAGASEWGLTPEQRTMLGLGKGSDFIYDPFQYLVMPRREVNASWWDDENLICERFITNQEHRWSRSFVFLNKLVTLDMTNPMQVKYPGMSVLKQMWKLVLADGSAADQDGADVPAWIQGLARFIKAFPLDMGTLDVVQDDLGNAYIVDVNTTPAFGAKPVPGLAEHLQGALIRASS